MRWLIVVCALLLLVSGAAALPNPPGSPNPSSGGNAIPSDALILEVPATVRPSFTVNISHTGPDDYSHCRILLDSVMNTSIFALAADEEKSFGIEAGQGEHTISASCALDAGGAQNISAERNVTVVVPAITILVPASGETLAGPDVTLVYRHTADGEISCTAAMDSALWLPGDSRWESEAVTSMIDPYENATVLFENVSEGTHRADVNCSGTGNLESHVVFGIDVPQEHYAVTIIEPPYNNTADVNVSFLHNGTGEANCSVEIDGDERDSIGLLDGVIERFSYTLAGGTHSLEIACDGEDWSADAEKLFIVDAQIPTNTSPSSIWIVGNPGAFPNITQGEMILVDGAGFVPDGAVRLYLLGIGIGRTWETSADDEGRFSYAVAESLPLGVYTITARSRNDLSVSAEQKLSVVRRPLQDENPGPGDDNDDADVLPPPVDQPPANDVRNPPARPDPILEQPAQVGGDGWSIWWWLAPLLMVMLILVGGGGYLAYAGRLDLSSVGAFEESVQRLFGQHKILPAAAGGSGGVHDVAEIKEFVAAERRKGYDDLTIRSALIAKGWNRDRIDRIFDTIYSGGLDK